MAEASADGVVEFMGLTFPRQNDVLVPRKETEILARAALSCLGDQGGVPLVVDVCCGSGNLGISLAVNSPRSRVFCCDLTEGAVTAARDNVVHFELTDRVIVRKGDLFAPLNESPWAESTDLVVCNPPYISTGKLETDRAQLLIEEPREAFDGGPYGIAILQRVLREAPDVLRPGGWLACEFGLGQARQVERLAKRSGRYDHLKFVDDEDGSPRVLMARVGQKGS